MSNVIRTVPAILAAAFAATATLTANAATDIYWKGGSGTEADPADVYNKDNWTASDTYSGNSISQNPTGQHHFHSGEQVIASNVAAGTTDNVVLDPASTVLDNRKGSLRVEGTNLILDIDGRGMLLMIK